MLQFIPCSVLMPNQMRVGPWLSPWLVLANPTDYLGLGQLVEDEQGGHWRMQDGRKLALADVTLWAHLYAPAKVAERLANHELLDEDGYPTEGALGLLSDWPWADPAGWLALAEALWSYPDRFVRREHPEYVEYLTSTGGWSGNESVLAAMKKNDVLWHSCWEESRRAGVTVFRLHRRDR